MPRESRRYLAGGIQGGLRFLHTLRLDEADARAIEYPPKSPCPHGRGSLRARPTRRHPGGAEHEHLQDGSRPPQVAPGRTRRLSRRRACRRRDHPCGVPELGAIGGLAVRFPGPSGKPRADDLHAQWRQPPHQPRLADAARLRRDGAAPQGPAGLGRRVLRVPGPLARPTGPS